MVDGEPMEMTATEYAVLKQLAGHAARVLTDTGRHQRVWKPEQVGEPWLGRDMVTRLRRKLGDAADNPNDIFIEPRVDYRMATRGKASKTEVGLRLSNSSNLLSLTTTWRVLV